MNKSDLTAYVAKSAEMTQEQAGKAIDAMVNAIQDSLASGNQVTLIGFGSFSVAERAARAGRNPRTGEEIQIPAAQIPQFKPGQTLKAAVALKPSETPEEPEERVMATKTVMAKEPEMEKETKTPKPTKSKKKKKIGA